MNKLFYTALGDSITNGFAARICDGFAFNLYNYFRHHFNSVKFNNFGVPGLTSKGLLNQLNKSQYVRHAIKNSDIITISIGGNNLRKSISDSYTHINKNMANEETLKFSFDWPAVLACIRNEIGSKAGIFVMTLFNPYCKSDQQYGLADFYICQLNNIIADPALINNFSYTVVDVYSLFKLSRGEDWTFFNYSASPVLRSPHPNSEGHYQITKAFINTIPISYSIT